MPAITGGPNVCAGGTITLSNLVSGGTWNIASSSIATIGSSSGLVTAISAGSSTVTYTISSGCYNTAPLIVNALPATITGASSVIVGNTVPQYCATSGGAWSSSNAAIGTIGTASGSVTGISAGTMTISYTLISTGCRSVKAFTVNPIPFAKDEALTDRNGRNIFAAYPNPTQGALNIETSIAGIFRIFTIDGKLIGSYNIKTPSATIQLPSDLASGIYMCQFNREDGTVETVRLIYRQ
jgi:hypothetical protein